MKLIAKSEDPRHPWWEYKLPNGRELFVSEYGRRYIGVYEYIRDSFGIVPVNAEVNIHEWRNKAIDFYI